MTESHSTEDLVGRGFRVGAFEVHPTLNRIDGPAGSVRLEPRIMAVLVCLARGAGTLVARDTIFRDVWGESGATDDVLSRAISSIRKAFGETSRDARLVETIPKAGYRFTEAPTLLDGPPNGSARVQGEPRLPVEETRRQPSGAKRAWLGWGLLAAAIAALVTAQRGTATAGQVDKPFEAQPQTLSALDGDEIHPAVSPDGERVVYAWRPEGSPSFDLHMRELDGSGPAGATAVTFTSDSQEISPTWSPEGRHLAFIRLNQSGCEVVLLEIERGTETAVHTCGENRYRRVRWSPTGDFLVLRGRATGSSTNRLFRLESGRPSS